MARQKAVVIGAGIAGLATAALLERQGWAVTILEKNSEVGGRAGSAAEAGFRWDTGPSWYLMPEAFDRFFQLCGTSTAAELDLVDLTPAYRIITEPAPEPEPALGPQPGSVLDVETGVEEVAALFDAVEPGAGPRVRAYLERSSEVYRLALHRFLYTTFSTPGDLFNREVLALLRRPGLLLRSLEREVAGVVTDPRLRQILAYPAVFLSTQPRRAPALYSLMSHTDLVEGVRYPLGGFAAVVDAIARQTSAEIVVNAPVEEIRIADAPRGRHGIVKRGRAVGVRAAGRTWPADLVVSAADLHHTETQLVPERFRTYPESYWSRRDPGLGTTLLLLGVRGELPQLAHHTLLLSRDWDADFRAVYDDRTGASRSIYISKPSATDLSVAPRGCENLFVLVPAPADPSFAADPDAVIDQIATWAGIADLRGRVIVKRVLNPGDFAADYNAWRGGALGPAHTLRQSAFLRGRNRSAKVDGLLYAGATTVPGVGVPMCLISAENAARVAGQAGRRL